MTNLTGKSERIAVIRQLIGESEFSSLTNCVDIQASGSGIYVIISTANEYVYVGQSISIGRRLREHIKLLIGKKHHSLKLQQDWVLFGADSFKCGILESVLPIGELLDLREDSWIDRLQSLDPLKGYNLQINGRAGSITFSPCEQIQLKQWTAVRRLSDGYWCATVLCGQFNKRAENWARLSFTQENLDLVQMPGQHPDKGIWCHPDLLIDLTSWISPRLCLAYTQHLRSIGGDDIFTKAFNALGF